MSNTIGNAKDTPLNVQTGTVPNVSGALLDWFQPMIFSQVVKVIINSQVVETMNTISFRGVIQPFKERDLLIKPEGERAWSWLWLHSDPTLSLNVDDVVNYLGVQTRVMARKNYSIYGYQEYQLVQDWAGSGPATVAP